MGTPRKCLMSEPRLAAFSYMLKEPSCQGIPSQMRPQYERELNQCVRETTIPTPLERLVEKFAQRSAKANLKSPGPRASGAKWSNLSVLMLLPAKPNNLNNVPRLASLLPIPRSNTSLPHAAGNLTKSKL